MAEELKNFEELRQESPEALARQILALHKELGDLREKNGLLEAENERLTFDIVTGLKLRRFFYEDLAERIKEMTEEELGSPETPEAVAFFDVNYLSFFNEELGRGHKGGDEALRFVSQAVKEADPSLMEGFRHGGDEIVGMIRGGFEAAEGMVYSVNVKLKNARVAGSELPVSVSSGVAHISEAFEAYRKFIAETKIEDPENKIDKIMNFLVAIADRRATRAKAMNSILKLIELKQQNPELYQKVKPYLEKGALRIGESSIEKLSTMTESEKLAFIEGHINGTLEARFEQEIEKIRIEHRLIAEIADRRDGMKKE